MYRGNSPDNLVLDDSWYLDLALSLEIKSKALTGYKIWLFNEKYFFLNENMV